MLKQQLQQKLQQKLSPQQIQLIRLLELPAIELEERVKHELEDNPALEEGKEPVDDFERTESEEGGEEIPSVDTETDLSLGDYLTEDDIPDYKLREMTERAERKEDVPFSKAIQHRRHIPRTLDGRTGSGLDLHTHFIGNDIGQCGLTKSRRAVKQHMV